ncbi:ribbon-helix-helix protein, CopG family [Geodermatophilus sp. TF02-6]|uniref:ribbon-helix-helix protein, CopG family n=1 Tax=Geodermatophilus sp. TF02-6 TaxID=2250575 RepID=UPI00131466F1|nr:ribbon-helix-helix protein, CopG family [Geodermatophilus sp. TF02-6]
MATEKDYQAAADWAEHQMQLRPDSITARRGAAAAQHGREALARALGGRPSIDPTAEPGEHARVRQVRLPGDLDRQLAAVAAAQHRSASAVMRDALADYLRAHPAS